MSSFSQDGVRRAAELREWITKEIANKQEELDKLRDTLFIIDSLLKNVSFTPASNIGIFHNAVTSEEKNYIENNDKPEVISNNIIDNSPIETDLEIKELRRVRDNLPICNAHVSSKYIKIVPLESIRVNINTTPFKTFFINRILEGMKTKDIERIQNGEIRDSELINYQINTEEDGTISTILITNYREKERIREIFNTVTWVFTRMLEKGLQQ